MTTIAVNKHMIAGDRQYTTGNAYKMVGGPKIFELPTEASKLLFKTNKAFVGYCGYVNTLAPIIEWLYDPSQKPPKFKKAEFNLVALTDKQKMYSTDDLSYWMEIKEPHFAIGSGYQYAIAAMESGKTPYEAVKVASKFDIYTGKGFDKLEM